MPNKEKFHKRFHLHFKTAALTLVAGLISTALYVTDHGSFLYRTSIVDIPQHASFDGTTYPVEKVPDWVNLDSDDWDKTYSAIDPDDFEAVPYYNPEQLKISTDSLEWGNADHNAIRNAKITYSTPYMGSYELNGKEYDGSHLAVDIKLPLNTPIYSIANGTVIKTSTQSTGFGHHVVIQHNNFPTLDDDSASETIYSSYNHLGNVLVTEGDVVEKGEMIALSGNTGTATTPHLHFQIDNDDAPWHPYWPFTWAEAQAEGYDFFEAVNEGLGYDDAIATTISPVAYVQKYMGSDVVYTPSVDVEIETVDEVENGYEADSYVTENSEEVTNDEDATVADDEDATVTNDEDVSVADEVIDEIVAVLDPPSLEFQLDVRSKYVEDATGGFRVLMRDQYGEVYEGGFEGEIVVSSQYGNVTANNSILRNKDFDAGEFASSFKRSVEGRDRLKVEYNGETYYSDWFEIIGVSTDISFSDISATHMYYEPIMYLASHGKISGYPDGTFKSSRPVSRVEVLVFILEGLGENLRDGNVDFTDVDMNSWYARHLFTAYDKGIVNGDPNGTYRPADNVNKAEFYKMLFETVGADVPPTVSEAPFADVPVDAWFAPYVALAKEIGIIDSGLQNLNPNVGMRRGEVADAMYRMMMVME